MKVIHRPSDTNNTGYLINIFKHITCFGRKGHHQVSLIRIKLICT